MSLEEAANWLKKFEEWFNWNEAINKKEYQTRRVILTNFLEEKILSNLRTDDTFTRETPIRGETINLLRRRFPFDQPLPWKKRPHGWIDKKMTVDHQILRCQGCGAQSELMHTRERCQVIDKVCCRCNIKGHYGRVCWNQRPPQPQTGNRYTCRSNQDGLEQWARTKEDISLLVWSHEFSPPMRD